MRTNVPPSRIIVPRTHEGAPTTNPLTPIQQLRRTLLTCMLFEDNFYENGVSVANRIKTLVSQCEVSDVCQLAIEARSVHHLRHVPLLLLREVLRKKGGRVVGDTIATVVQRADELAELVSLYWADAQRQVAVGADKHVEMKRAMLPKQLRIGLGRAFRKFDEYQLAKYNRDYAVKLRDVLFMTHAKPKKVSGEYRTKAQRDAGDTALVFEPTTDESLYRRIVDDKLATPDTWEVALSATQGEGDKGDTWERLLAESKLGGMALLRNLRNMEQAGVSPTLVQEALRTARFNKVLPFRFISAYRAVTDPGTKIALDICMMKNLAELPMLKGRTLVLVDVSGSMDAKMGGKSDLTRMDTAAALAILLRGVCEAVHVATFSQQVVSVQDSEGIALAHNIVTSQPHGGTWLGNALNQVHQALFDRLIVITDEQTADRIPDAVYPGKEYIINVAPYQQGVGYKEGYVKIDGFSEAVVSYIQALEAQE